MPKYIKGLNKDTGHIDQVEGTYRYARNAILNDRVGAIQNEHGTSSYVLLPKPSAAVVGDAGVITAIGSIETTDDRIVIFAVGEGTRSDFSIIYLVEKNTWDNYPATESRATILLVTLDDGIVVNQDDQLLDVDLKFSINFPIEGTYKIDADGDLIAYWTDNNSPPRSLNVTRQRSFTFIEPGIQPYQLYTGVIYGKDPVNSPNLTYIDRLNLFPHAGPVPRIVFKEVKNGGALKSGTYYLFLAYVDIKATQTNYITSSLPVPIVEDVESVLPIERYDGAPADSQTGKMISWTISNINTDYEYLRPVVVSRINNIQAAYRLNDIETGTMGEEKTISFSMLEGYEAAAVEDVIIDSVAYDTAKTMTQLDSVLYLGNLSGSKDVGYQKNANFIKVRSVISTFKDFDPFSLSRDNLDNGFYEDPALISTKENGYRDLHNIVNKRGYMRDEVYAFYIAFILNDGSMSYAYHIPGREKFTDVKKERILNVGSAGYANLPDTVDEDLSLTDIDEGLNRLTSESGKLFHFYDFSDLDFTWDTRAQRMSYWENLNEFYPNTDDFKVYDGDLDTGTDLGGTRVRHHHFPSNLNKHRSVIDHDAEINEPTEAEETITQHYYFTWHDIEDTSNITSYNDVELHISSTDDVPYFEDTAQYNPLYNLWEDLTGPGGDYEGAQHLIPTGATLDMLNNLDSLPGWELDGNDNYVNEFYMAELQHLGGSISGGDYILGAGNNNPSGSDGTSAVTLQSGTSRGFAMYTVTTNVLTTTSYINQVVRPMGIKLIDLKIPVDIADKVQGFRIYYASRDHNNRRILGQDHIKETILSQPKDIGACGTGTSSSHQEEFLVAPGNIFRYEDKLNTGNFHDFYMLNGGYGGETAVSKGLSTATHVNKLHNFSFFSFKGPGYNYPDVDASSTTACQAADSTTAFHMCHSSELMPDKFLHYPMREKCRTYVEGDSIYDGRSLGFGKRIYNLGGEKHIALAFSPDRPLSVPSYTGAPAANWHVGDGQLPNTPSELVTSPVSNPTTAVELPIYNLCAFKTDMYMSTDTQRLVWTGYEVLGDDLDKFISRPDQPGEMQNKSSLRDDLHPFITSDIYGGDIFICRHGYRVTHRPEFVGTQARDRKAVIATICESSDNINLRNEESDNSAYFPGAPLKRVLDLKADVNLTDTVNIKYNADYSLGTKDVKFPPALPLRDLSPSVFPNRVQRSATADNASIIDNYRVFLGSEIKDLPRNRGDLWNLISFNNLLYIHMQDTLFKTKGKQTMQMADGTEAYLGSGNIFEQDPDELMQTDSGYAGTQSQWAALVTSSGYFCVDYRNRKVYMITEKITDIGQNGLVSWFRENIPFALENYGIEDFDNPIAGVGFHSVWDEKYSRILLTKRDLVPTASFINLWNSGTIRFNKSKGTYEIPLGQGQVWTPLAWDNKSYFKSGGWTVSYSPATSSWVSFHDYIPYLYTYEKQHILSMIDGFGLDDTYNENENTLWEHSTAGQVGNFYRVVYPFEFEFVYNKAKDDDKVFYSFDYTVDVYNNNNVLLHNQGFTSFYTYTTHQFSGENPLEYLINTRRIGNEWKVNKFRDIATLINSTDAYYIGPHTGSNYGVPGANVAGAITNNVITTQIADMFIINGMSETINAAFINNDKPWFRQRKFTDKWLGIRLIYSNSTQNLIYLYAADVASKQFYR